jgi:hypothetical protein
VREDELRDEEPREEDGGFGGSGDATVARSIVAKSSVFSAGRPQAEQKRTETASSDPHEEQKAMIFLAYSLNQTSDAGR